MNNQPWWRTEPEIDDGRQEFLRQRLMVVADIYQGVYAFKDIKLTRADVEWLLANHEQGRGPVDANDPTQRGRQSIDVRGADLRHVDLRNLPLTGLQGGMTQMEWVAATLEQRALAGVHLEQADLSGAHLDRALLRGAFLQGATLRKTFVTEATLFQANLAGTYLREANLEGANMMYTHLEGAYLRKAFLSGADLRHAICDTMTILEKVSLRDGKWGCVLLADVHWNDCNLTSLDWRRVMPLGDEKATFDKPMHAKGINDKERQHRLDAYQAAIRANRQLTNTMRAQGMNDEAIPFAYRAQVLRRTLLWHYMLWGTDTFPSPQPQHGRRGFVRTQLYRLRNLIAYLFSWFLDIIAGFGYKPERSLGIYLLTVLSFTLLYLFAAGLSLREALIFSVTAFHGRGFITGTFKLDDPITAFAALEAVIGLFIEISFIATFTQRFFGR